MVSDASAAPLPADPAAPWRAPLLVKASVACHVGAGIAVAALPSTWPFAVGALGLNHALLTATGLWPRSTWLGQNMSRLPDDAAARGEVAITIDDGPDPQVTPAVLDLLDAHGAKATFFCIAERARAHPVLCRQIVARGHSVQNHSRDHSHRFSLFGPKRFARDIGAAQAMLADVTGQMPRYFRAPAGLRNPLLAPVLQRLGLELVSWTRRGYDTVQRRPERVLQRLTRRLRGGDILLLHDGNAARGDDGRAVLLSVLPALLQVMNGNGLYAATLPKAHAVPATTA